MKNIAAVAISILVVIAIFVAIELLIGRPGNVPEKLELAAKLEWIDASVPHGVLNQEELKRLKKFIVEKKSLALGALVLFNAGGNKVSRYNSRDLGDGKKFVFELSDDGSVFRNRLIDSEKRIKR